MDVLRRQLEVVVRDKDQAVKATEKIREELERFKKEQANPVERKKGEVALEEQEIALKKKQYERARVPTDPKDALVDAELAARQAQHEADMISLREVRQTNLVPAAYMAAQRGQSLQFQKNLLINERQFGDAVNACDLWFAASQGAYRNIRNAQMRAEESRKKIAEIRK